MDSRYDIASLRMKAEHIQPKGKIPDRFYKNTEYNVSESDDKIGFMLRCVVSVCLALGFIVCKLGSTEQTTQVFQTISEGISDNQSIGDMKQSITKQIEELFLDVKQEAVRLLPIFYAIFFCSTLEVLAQNVYNIPDYIYYSIEEKGLI